MKATEITNVNCEYYGNTFSRADRLKNHIHTDHEGGKDYKCESY